MLATTTDAIATSLHSILESTSNDTLYDAVFLAVSANPSWIQQVHPKHGGFPLHTVLRQERNSRSSSNVALFLLRQYTHAARVPDYDGNFPIHLLFQHTIYPISYVLVREILDAYPDGIKTRDHNGELPLHLALHWTQHRSFFDVWHWWDLENKSITGNVNQYSNDEDIAHAIPGSPGQLQDDLICVVHHVFDCYGDAAINTDRNGSYPLFEACQTLCDDETLVGKILDANPLALLHSGNDGGYTVFHALVHQCAGNSSILIDHQSNPVSTSNVFSIRMMELMFDRYPDMVSRGLQVPDQAQQRLPLHYAVAQGDAALVEIVVKMSPDARFASDRDGSLPLHLLPRHSSLPLVQSLVDSDTARTVFVRTQSDGSNALHNACYNGVSVECIQHLLECVACLVPPPTSSREPTHIQPIHRLRYDLLSATNNQGHTALHCALLGRPSSSSSPCPGASLDLIRWLTNICIELLVAHSAHTPAVSYQVETSRP